MRIAIAAIVAVAICLVGNGVSVCENRVTKPCFFPDDAFDTDERKDDGLHEQWYSKHLAAMHEPALYNPTQPQNGTRPDAYRFLWLRSFDHPISVRVEKGQGEKARLFVKELDGKGGYAPGILAIEKAKTLSEEQWSGLTKQIEECGFWNLPTLEQHWYVENGLIVGWGMTDGAQWVLEGTKGKGYHVVDRQSPDDDNHREAGKFRAACVRFLELSGLDMTEDRIY